MMDERDRQYMILATWRRFFHRPHHVLLSRKQHLQPPLRAAQAFEGASRHAIPADRRRCAEPVCDERIFLQNLTDEQAKAIRDILSVEPGEFWRACKGRTFLDLPPRIVQLELFER